MTTLPVLSPEIILRWTIWHADSDLLTMLNHSIGTFQRFFGSKAQCVVVTDTPEIVSRALRVKADVMGFNREDAVFDDDRSTWKKWCPRPRLSPGSIEIYVDADIFLLAEPREILDFCSNTNGAKYFCARESFAEGFYGNFVDRIDHTLPHINAGLLGQSAATDLTDDLLREYEWWHEQVEPGAVDYHDEQGAVRAALEPALHAGEVLLLPSERYRVVCPLTSPPVESVEGLTLLHATFPHRPAFWKFLPEISAISGLSC